MKLTIQLTDHSYDVIIEEGCIHNVSRYVDIRRNIFIITDTGVPHSIIDSLHSQFKSAYVYTLEAGEQSKNFENYENILKKLLELNFTRKDLIIAVGGGVVGDEEFGFLKMLIQKYGLFDSNIVCKSEDNGRYTILSGHRRIQATRELIYENLILQTKVPIHIKNFDSKEEEVAFIIQMNTSSRERNDIDKLNEIYQFSYTLKNEKPNVTDQEIVNQLLNVVKLGESQLKKYLRLFKSVEWDGNEVNRLFIEYENINRWDKTRELDQREIKSIDKVSQKKLTNFEENELYKIKPTQKVRDMAERVFTYFDKAESSIIDLSKQSELSREGVKTIRALTKSIIKNKEAILKFNADVKGDSNEN